MSHTVAIIRSAAFVHISNVNLSINAGLSRIFSGRAPRTAWKHPQTRGENVPGPCRSTGVTFPPRIPPLPWSPLAARGKRVAPESCRTGHLRASSPLRSAVRHGLVVSRLASRPRSPTRRFPPPGNFLSPALSAAPVPHRNLLILFFVLHEYMKYY